jgi:SHS2 domain-containing protein
MPSERIHGDENLAPAWLQPVDHTADRGIIVQAADMEELFARAAWGMFAIITDMEAVHPAHSEKMVVTAPDRHALLVRWLSELNFQHATRHWLYSRFHILKLSDQQLEAEVGGENIAAERHTIHTEIKAVTFHGLRLEPAEKGWRAEIIFDL